MHLGEALVHGGVAGLELQRAARGHGVPGVGGQVDQDLVQLPGVGPDRPQRVPQRHGEPHILADDPGEHALGPGQHIVGVDHLGRDDLLAREGQQLTGQVRGPLGGLDDLLDVGADLRALPQLLEDHVRIARDAGEQVVEVVGHATSELTDRLHLLRLPQLLLQPRALLLVALALGDVEEGGDHVPWRGLEGEDLIGPLDLVVLVGHLGGLPRLTLARGAPVALGDLGLQQGGEGLLDGQAHELIVVDAEHSVRGGVGPDEDQASIPLQAVAVHPHR